MKISVIIPAYNAAKWVEQCLRNMQRQTYRNLEVLVVDDGSKDDTFELATAMAAESDGVVVRVIRQENSGSAAARNRGFDESTGDYVHFMDVDDLLPLDFYERMAAAAEQADADMAVCGIIDETHPYWTHSYKDKLLLIAPEDKFGLTNVYSIGYAWRWLIRRSLLAEHALRFNVEQMVAEDLMLTMQAVFHARAIVTVPEVCYHYRRREGSILANRDREFVRRRNAGWSGIKRWRNEFMAAHGLSALRPARIEDSIYRLLGIPVAARSSTELGRKTAWRIFGLKVWERKKVQLK